jgi:signal-transduction protein with cAMP-binding, CBS, and nucleotidyltransferase domain
MMVDKEVSTILIRSSEKISGIITEHDIVEKVVVKRQDPEVLKASEIMSKPVYTVNESMDLVEASRIMRDKKVKSLLCAKAGKVSGIITASDIVAASPVIRHYLIDED